MAILGIKSIPLEKETNRAWKTVPGMYFASRRRDKASLEAHIAQRPYELVLNLGRRDIDFDLAISPVANRRDLVRSISRPLALRELIDDYLPERSVEGAHWHKAAGFAGRGKRRCTGECGGLIDVGEDIQREIIGQEFRILTVGEKVVQASEKRERVFRGGRNEFTYEWVGVQGVSRGGIIPVLKEVTRLLPDPLAVVGWDIIHDGARPYILEGNTSPGVNEATAARIISALRSAL